MCITHVFLIYIYYCSRYLIWVMRVGAVSALPRSGSLWGRRMHALCLTGLANHSLHVLSLYCPEEYVWWWWPQGDGALHRRALLSGFFRVWRAAPWYGRWLFSWTSTAPIPTTAVSSCSAHVYIHCLILSFLSLLKAYSLLFLIILLYTFFSNNLSNSVFSVHFYFVV